jgi:hypothetical protein
LVLATVRATNLPAQAKAQAQAQELSGCRAQELSALAWWEPVILAVLPTCLPMNRHRLRMPT